LAWQTNRVFPGKCSTNSLGENKGQLPAYGTRYDKAVEVTPAIKAAVVNKPLEHTAEPDEAALDA